MSVCLSNQIKENFELQFLYISELLYEVLTLQLNLMQGAGACVFLIKRKWIHSKWSKYLVSILRR